MIPLDELGDDQFESLVVELARKLLGEGVQGFTKGRDGGRDARFVGRAERFPSTSSPWSGITIIQAKHDNGLNGHFAEAAFSGATPHTVISKEIVRLQNLVAQNDLDNYLLVSNRRLAGGTNTTICQRISTEVGLEIGNVHIWGGGDIARLIDRFPDVMDLAKIRWADTPLIVNSADLCEVIIAIADAIKAPANPEDSPVVPRTSYEEKNELNGMTDDFARTLETQYLKFTGQIQKFLSKPENDEVRERYEDAADEFRLKIVAKRAEYDTFDQVFVYLTDQLTRRDPVLSTRVSARLVRTVIFHMYWFCDIGLSASEV
ncbi:ABC-three component system protein [Arthrobacter sp. U41]|uniref:ABC-three component system protein n=1 Tax=Arthrobacter sp. U41 TaxID=1849032 RepID=UPI0008594F82|nr:ABC-three component system protein [Arthrobacter sp. U41]AOT05988.1 hypothetical protein ASPU41_21395 [Arthrobacter sp. U41]